MSNADQSYFLYTVRKGDTLSDICRRYHVGIRGVETANKWMNCYRLLKGDELFIPAGVLNSSKK